MKQEFRLLCECKKEIIGFSEKHLKKNLEIHRLISKEHRDRIKLIKNVRFGRIDVSNLSNELIVEMLANHPIMIEDMREIGRKQNQEEKDYEKKIMVS